MLVPGNNLPRLGTYRQKRTQQQMVEQLLEELRRRGGMSRFSRTGTPRGGRRAPFRMPGAGVRAMPQGLRGPVIGDFLGPRGMGGGRPGNQLPVVGPPSIHAGPPAALPIPLPPGPPSFNPPIPVAGNLPDISGPTTVAGTPPNISGPTTISGTPPSITGPTSLPGGGSMAGGMLGAGYGGLIPLGGGVYYDPIAGTIHGTGLQEY